MEKTHMEDMKKESLKKRYERNTVFSSEEQIALAEKTVFVAGCGGLGGYICEMLARVGVGNLVLADGDVFEESNLNRQLASTEENLGKNKACEMKKRIQQINAEIEVQAIPQFVDENNGLNMIKGADLVMDALDSRKSKLMLQDLCKKAGIPMVHGGVSGWQGQVCTIMPGDDTLCVLYGGHNLEKSEKVGTPSFTPAVAAGIQVAKAIRLLLGKENAEKKSVLFFGLLEDEWYEVELKGEKSLNGGGGYDR